MKKILIFGSNGLVGKSLQRKFENKYKQENLFFSNRNDTDLFSFKETKNTIDAFEPDVLINAAAKVGGIYANNSKRTEFLIENLKINLNILLIIIITMDKPVIQNSTYLLLFTNFDSIKVSNFVSRRGG